MAPSFTDGAETAGYVLFLQLLVISDPIVIIFFIKDEITAIVFFDQVAHSCKARIQMGRKNRDDISTPFLTDH